MNLRVCCFASNIDRLWQTRCYLLRGVLTLEFVGQGECEFLWNGMEKDEGG